MKRLSEEQKRLSEEQKIERDVTRELMKKGVPVGVKDLPSGLLSDMSSIALLGTSVSMAVRLDDIDRKLNKVLGLLNGRVGHLSRSQEKKDSTWDEFKRYIESSVPVGSCRFLRALEVSGIDSKAKLFAQGARTLLMVRRNFAAKSVSKLRVLAGGFFGRYPW